MRPANFWSLSAAPRPLPCSPVTVSACPRETFERRSTNELGGVLVDRASRGYRLDTADRHRNSHRILADLFPLALEISGRGRGCASHRPAADCARLLCPRGAWFAEPAWPLVGVAHRPHSGLHLRRAGDRVFVIQPAICRTTVRRIIRRSRFQSASSFCIAWPFAVADLSPHRASPLKGGASHRICTQLCAHAGRVWSCAHGGRQYPRRDA